MNVLKHLIQGRDFLILVIGEQGTGKTTMLNQFLYSARGDWRSCRIRAQSTEKTGGLSSLKNLNEHPAFILPDDKLPIVMFDDAHELNKVELQYLLKDALAPGGVRKLKRLVLFCEPSINATMASLSAPFTKETVVNKVYMSPANKKETYEYLMHRLKIAGYKGKNPFKSSDVETIYKASGGIPGNINKEAHKFLISRFEGEKPGSAPLRPPGIFKKKSFRIAIGAIVLFCLTLILFFWNRNDLPPTPYKPPKPIIKSKEKTDVAKTVKKPPAAGIAAVSDKGSEKTVGPPVAIKDKAAKPEEPIPLETKAQTKKSAVELSRPAQKVKKSEKAAPVKPKKAKKIHRESWIMAQNPSYYTLQIIGLRNEKSVQKFAKKHHLLNKVAYYKTKYRGKRWYPLLYGAYPTRKKALSAINELPKEIRKLSPWTRKLSSIQQAIRKNNKNF